MGGFLSRLDIDIIVAISYSYLMTDAMAGSVIPTMKYGDLDEKVLIELCITSEGDAWRDAWAEIVARFSKYVYSVLWDKFKLPKEDIDDIYQNVCEKLMRNRFSNLKKFQGKSKFTTWLARFSINCGHDFLRATNKQTGKKTKGGDSGQKKEEKQENGEVRGKDPEKRHLDAAEHGETTLERHLRARDAIEVRQHLHKLPPRDRMLLTLRYYEDKSYKDIARILNIPINTVSSGISRALKKLKELLGDEDDG